MMNSSPSSTKVRVCARAFASAWTHNTLMTNDKSSKNFVMRSFLCACVCVFYYIFACYNRFFIVAFLVVFQTSKKRRRQQNATYWMRQQCKLFFLLRLSFAVCLFDFYDYKMLIFFSLAINFVIFFASVIWRI